MRNLSLSLSLSLFGSPGVLHGWVFIVFQHFALSFVCPGLPGRALTWRWYDMVWYRCGGWIPDSQALPLSSDSLTEGIIAELALSFFRVVTVCSDDEDWCITQAML